MSIDCMKTARELRICRSKRRGRVILRGGNGGNGGQSDPATGTGGSGGDGGNAVVVGDGGNWATPAPAMLRAPPARAARVARCWARTATTGCRDRCRHGVETLDTVYAACVATSRASKAPLPRGRRSARPSGDERELAILATAERLLADRPLADISVDDLARGAGISRPTFYFYFPSKEAVLLTLLDRVVNEADTALQALADRPESGRDDMWRTGINVFVETFGAHRAVIRGGQGVRAINAEARDLWSVFMQKWIAYTASVIEAERERGAAPVTLPALELATALNLMNERALSASFLAEEPSVPEASVLDTLVHIWVSAIYGDKR